VKDEKEREGKRERERGRERPDPKRVESCKAVSGQWF